MVATHDQDSSASTSPAVNGASDEASSPRRLPRLAAALNSVMGVREATARGAAYPAPIGISTGEATFDTEGQGAIEWHAPVMVKTDSTTTIPYLLQRRVQRSARQPLIEVKRGMGNAWHAITASEFYDAVMETAAGLIGMGLEFGDMVAIMSRTRYEWTLLDFACWFAGLVPVPIYETSSIDQIAFIIRDTGVKAMITETITMAELAKAAAAKADAEVTILSLDSEAIRTIVDAGASIPRTQVTARSARLTTDSIATIVYTSGTTGQPKGVVLSHGNFTIISVNSHQWMPEVAMAKGSRLLLFLPLAHVFARFLQVFQLSGNGVLGHTSDTRNLLSDLETFRPSYLLVVPRVLEKIYNSADAKASAGGKQKIFRWAAKVAISYSKASKTPEGSSRKLSLARATADRLVYSKIYKLVGGNARFIISGGAPLAEHLAHFYTGMGLPVLEGYGLTETVGPLSVNTPRLNKIGTVGPPVPPVSVRISEEGEILIKGPSVFKGYHNCEEATSQAFTEDGWFKTGDLGSLDRDGYLRITGRAKEIIVTAGGKNVSPASLEDPLRSHPLISQVVVVGDRRPFISALVTLDSEMLPLWLKGHGLPPMSVTEAATDIEVLASLDRAVEKANQGVSRAESIREVRVLTTDFTEANGLLTPSLKVKRAAVVERFADVINDIYGAPLEDSSSSV